MIYQLPNGRVIHLTVEEYLDLTDADIHYLISTGAGDYKVNPFYDSVIKDKKTYQDYEMMDTSIDYTPEDADKSHGDNIAPEDSYDEFPDFPDTDTQE